MRCMMRNPWISFWPTWLLLAMDRSCHPQKTFVPHCLPYYHKAWFRGKSQGPFLQTLGSRWGQQHFQISKSMRMSCMAFPSKPSRVPSPNMTYGEELSRPESVYTLQFNVPGPDCLLHIRAAPTSRLE